jgi:hypothetical protein
VNVIDATDYVVGYGRPPRATQFAAGKSGNPKGRPKGSRTVGAILQNILSQKIVVTENGKTRRIPTLEVMFRRLVNDAVRRDAAALKLLLPLIDRYAASPETKLRFGELLAEDQAILSQYLSRPAGSGSGWAKESETEGLGDGILERKFQALLRSNFRAFVHKAFTTLCPGQDLSALGMSMRLRGNSSASATGRSAA